MPPRRVRFLAPFDPVVWDRRRFEHLWGWPYRFEAYTPSAKRIRGYYAMPLLWCDRVIGWANAGIVEQASCRSNWASWESGLRIASSNRNSRPRLPGWRPFSTGRDRHEPRRGRCPHLPSRAIARYGAHNRSSFRSTGQMRTSALAVRGIPYVVRGDLSGLRVVEFAYLKLTASGIYCGAQVD